MQSSSQRAGPDSKPGRVASLHLHPREPGEPFVSVEALTLVAEKGIAEDERYFDRVSSRTGQPSRRQVSVIAREQIAEHAVTLGLESIAPGAVRSNIETRGIDLSAFVGQEIEIGEAALFVYALRTPCPKMDAICPGLRALMENGHQGVVAQVIRSGRIRVGDAMGGAGAMGS
jgi:MOSC domain-containing protein YiiM